MGKLESMTWKALKSVGKAITNENTVANGGGLSSLLVPRKLNPGGVGLVLAGSTLFGATKGGVAAHNKRAMGYVTYDETMARMTGPYNSGVVPAMMNASHGDYGVFSEMAKDVVSNKGLSGIDDYGATPQMISALYNMGGR